jgi:hypothetical protein
MLVPVDPGGLFEALMNGLAQVPSALIAAALLAGPTAIWLIARFVNPPDLATRDELALEELLWVCPNCRSINEDRMASCYRCHGQRAAESIPLIIERAPTFAGPGVGIAVGPGTPAPEHEESWIEREVARASMEVEDDVAWEEEEEEEEEEEVLTAELALLAYEAVVLEPRVKASGRPAASKPAAKRTRRKPPAATDAGAAKPRRARKTGSG